MTRIRKVNVDKLELLFHRLAAIARRDVELASGNLKRELETEARIWDKAATLLPKEEGS